MEGKPHPSNFFQSAKPTLLNGDAFPRLIYGSSIREHRKPADIRAAFQKGYRGLDTTSTRRFHDEELDGQALRELLASDSPQFSLKREDIWVQTKFSIAFDQSDPWPYDPGDELALQVLKSIQRSLSDLGVEIVDAYFLSCQLDTFEDTLDAWRAMETLVEHGIARYLGICHVDARSLTQLLERVTIKPAFVQNEFVLDHSCNSDVWEICKEYGIVYQVFGLFWKHNNNMLSLAPVQQLAQSTSSTTHVALQMLIWAAAIDDGLYFSMLDGTRDEEHMALNLQLLEAFHSIPSSFVKQFRAMTDF
ncbi:Aldo/keto reductase [Trematosphaeria pertusa]|uniref:Aldo/keto reductase n=1 Tax=Trematosphaeria pertusa TaxID=390896 RepID=A0A6A6IBY0_9PLEO|nr:Aldo/keto reductase [Trematosphaeria pertusa]KAF2247759.1 Aldo/keto reductase [Trematosphaeria pertusa]